jgi:hypothetical protein
MVVQAEPPGSYRQPSRKTSATIDMKGAQPMKVLFPELLEHVRVPSHHHIVGTTEGARRGKNEARVMGNERLPRSLANGRVWCVKKLTEF